VDGAVSISTAPIWMPSEDSVAGANVTAFARWLGREPDYHALWRWSVDDLDGFWDAVWRYYSVRSTAPHERVLGDRAMPGARWFEGAQLNYAEHVLERAAAAGPAIVALDEAREPSELTAAQLRAQVGALAATLRRLGVRPGDRVAAYLPNIPEAVVAMLATASVGAVWAACAPDFGGRSVVDRLGQVEPTVLIAVDGYRFGGREHDRTDAVADLRAALPGLRATIAVDRLGLTIPDALPFAEAIADAADPAFEQVPFDHPLWVLFSSGTTGVPKGIVQSHGGIVIEHLKGLGLNLDLRAGDRYFFHSSTSWMAWNFLVGGLLHGATVVLYDGSPGYPDADALWTIAEQTRATVLGMGAAYVSACQNAALQLAHLDLSALRTAIPTGSPLPPAGWRWLAAQLPPGTRIDPICGGTDVCTAFMGGSPLLPVREGEIPCRWLGVAAEAWDEGGGPVVDEVGEFVVTQPMPSMPVRLWNDDGGARYRETYFDTFDGVWRQGDWVTVSPEGSIVVLGRSDSTLNRDGVRIGSAEIYAVVEAFEEIADSLVVGVEHPDGSYSMPLFVVPVEGATVDDRLRERLIRALRREASPRHVPDAIVEAPAVPRTLTGKKLEVPVKRILQGATIDEASSRGAVDRPEILEWFAARAAGGQS
jgi:acetoacetyl-CoA synthetase